MAIDLKNISQKSAINKPDKKIKPIAKILSKEIRLFKAKLSDKFKEEFYSELVILISSGIDIKNALDILSEEQKKQKYKEVVTNINEKITKGNSFSEALESREEFTPYEYYSVKIGEQSGRLIDVLKDISGFYSKKIIQKRKLINSFSYPILVLLTAVLAVFFMMNFIIPMFQDVFHQFNNELPPLTKTIINISDFFSRNIWYLIIFILAIIQFYLTFRKKEWMKKYTTGLILRLPVIKNLVKMIFLERFFQSFHLLISSKIPILTAISLIKKMISFYPLQKALEQVEQDITNGGLLFESLKKFKIFDHRTVSLIKVAEEVNKLDTISEKLSKQYSEKLEHQISIVSSLMEPFIIIFIGGFVGVILVAMYLPMFKISTTIY